MCGVHVCVSVNSSVEIMVCVCQRMLCGDCDVCVNNCWCGGYGVCVSVNANVSECCCGDCDVVCVCVNEC